MNERVFPRIEERYLEAVLENGLTVRVLPKPKFDKLYAVIAVNYGAIDTAFVKDGIVVRTPAGVAHYLEHKMFDLPEGNASEGFSALGGFDNAFTAYDMTAYYVQADQNKEENLRLLLHMVFTPYFTEASVEKERGIIAEEIRMYEDSADSKVYEQMLTVMFPDHPISLPIAGSVESIGEITAKTLYDCHRAFYRPDNMILCVEGSIDPARVFEIAKEETPGREVVVYEKLRPEPAPLLCENICTEMDVALPIFHASVRLPDMEKGDPVTEIACDLAAEFVTGEASKCYQELYEAGLIDAGFYAGYECIRELAMLCFGGESEDPQQVFDRVFEAAARLRETGVDPTELERLKRSSVGRKLRELDSFTGTCNRICGDFFDGVEYLDFRAAFDAVTERDVLRILDCFVPERACLSIIEPRKGEPA